MSSFTVGMLFTLAFALAGMCHAGFVDVHKMPFGRSDMSVSVYKQGNETRMYLIGGCDKDQICSDPNDPYSCACGGLTNKTQYYRVEEDRYVTTPTDTPRARYRHAAAQMGGKIYLFGGRSLADSVITEVDMYDIATNTWSTPCTWINATSDNAAFVEGNVIYLVGGWTGGYSPNNVTYSFNPNGCVFTRLADMPSARGDAVATTVTAGGKNYHFVVGGFGSSNCFANSVVETYNATSDSWMMHNNFSKGRADMALGEIGSNLYAIGGETINSHCNRSVPVTDVEKLSYDSPNAPFAGSWTVEQQVPSSRFRFIGASAANGIYLFGGQGGYTTNLDGSGKGGFPILNTTMIYRLTPPSTASPTPPPTSAASGVAASWFHVIALVSLCLLSSLV